MHNLQNNAGSKLKSKQSVIDCRPLRTRRIKPGAKPNKKSVTVWPKKLPRRPRQNARPGIRPTVRP
jgi:hypothetical protein